MRRLLVLIFVAFNLLVVYSPCSWAFPCVKDSDCDKVCEKCINGECELKEGKECSAHHECSQAYTNAPRPYCINCQCQCDRNDQCSAYNPDTNSYPVVCCNGKCKEKCD